MQEYFEYIELELLMLVSISVLQRKETKVYMPQHGLMLMAFLNVGGNSEDKAYLLRYTMG